MVVSQNYAVKPYLADGKVKKKQTSIESFFFEFDMVREEIQIPVFDSSDHKNYLRRVEKAVREYFANQQLENSNLTQEIHTPAPKKKDHFYCSICKSRFENYK